MIGILLAGGRARRFGGGDKGRHAISSKTILDHVVTRLRPQCEALVLNANGDPARFHEFDIPVVADTVSGQPGPLAGVLAGLYYAVKHHPAARSIVTVPIDLPFLPPDLVVRLVNAQITAKAAIVCARSHDRVHSLAALWSVELRLDLKSAICVENLRKVSSFISRHPSANVDWPAIPYDPFFNVNTPEDLEKARQIAAKYRLTPNV